MATNFIMDEINLSLDMELYAIRQVNHENQVDRVDWDD